MNQPNTPFNRQRKSAFRFLLMLLLTTLASTLSAQTLHGIVTDGSNHRLKGVSVSLLDSSRLILSFAMSAADGRFSLEVPEGKRGALLRFSRMGYAADTLDLQAFKNGQTVVLGAREQALREVQVRAQAIRQRGDTIDYLVSRFKNAQDRSIADVLKKMPGLKVSEDGGISYQGKPINKFYVEGMDMMGGKYAMVSENLSADKVSKVQVMENHQPVKALKDVSFSENAALNIILKPDAKDVWQGALDGAIGCQLQGDKDLLGDVRAIAMLFSRRKQSLSMYKFNNTGKDIRQEISQKSIFDVAAPTAGGFVSNLSAGSDVLSNERTAFNRTHIFGNSWLFKLSKDAELRTQLTGLWDKSAVRQQYRTIYTDVVGDSVIDEVSSADSYRAAYSGELLYIINSDKLYLRNTASGYIDFNHSFGQAQLNGRSVVQAVSPHRSYFSDYIDFIRRFSGGKSFGMKAYFSYNYLPSSLLLADNSWQVLNQHALYWGLSTNFRHRLFGFNITYDAGLDGVRQQLRLHNFMAHQRYIAADNKAYLIPRFAYKTERFEVELDADVSLYLRRLDDERKVDLTVNPTFLLAYKPTARWSFRCFAGLYKGLLEGTSALEAPIFTSYMSLRRGNGKPDFVRSANLSATIAYKNVLKGYFANLNMQTSRTSHVLLYRNALHPTYFYYQTVPTDLHTHSSNYGLEGEVSKSFDWKHMLLSLSGQQSWNNSNMLLQTSIIPLRMLNGGARASVSIRPVAWLSLFGKTEFSYSKQQRRDALRAASPTYLYYRHALRAGVVFGAWQLNWNNELFHDNDDASSAHFFADVDLRYVKKQFEVGFYLHNIFGHSTFERRYITSTQRSYTLTTLRPREFLVRAAFSF